MADLIAPLPMIVLKSGQTIRFEAIDPTTGADVAGVTITAATIYGATEDDAGGDEHLLNVYLLGRGD